MEEERLEAAARKSTREREREESKRKSETPQGTWLDGAQRGSLWLCYAGQKQKELWLRNRKVRSQVSGIERSQFPGRRTVGEVRRGRRQGRRASDRAKKRVRRFRVRPRWKRRASRLPCLRLGLGDDWWVASFNPAPMNSRLNVVVRFPTPFGLVRNGCWPFRGSQLPRAVPFILVSKQA